MSSFFQLRVGSLDVDRMLVHAFEGREELSKGYRFDVVASIAKPDAHDVEASLLGREACLSLAVGGSARAIRGIVAAVAVLGANRRGRITTRLRLVPRLARLEHRRTSRIFQDQSIPDIVRAVLDEQGIASEWRLGSNHPPHGYCVQYQETDAELVHRLLAEAGIFYWFRHDEHDEPTAVETVVFADHAGAYAPIPSDPNLVFRPSAGSALEQEEHHVHRFEAKRALAPRSLRMRDYDFKRPSLGLGSAALIESEGPAASVEARSPRRTAPFEVYQHPGEVDDPVVRDDTASRALDAARRRAATGRGRSACARLLPGHHFLLGDHDVPSLDGAHVVTRVDHRGIDPESAREGEPLYANRFRTAPASMPIRPPCAPRPVRQVAETALVVGPRDHEIHTDEHGRIKVQFHWDQEGQHNEHSSCWIRVVHPWAGASWGFQFVPRVGMEVVVAFLGGDPDRPVVIGSVNNALTPVTHKLPLLSTKSAIRTQSTPGGGGYNEILFEDRAGEEELAFTAQRNLRELTRNDRITHVGNDEERAVTRNRTVTIGGDEIESIGGDKSDLVGGAHQQVVGGRREKRVGGDDLSNVGGALIESARETMRSAERDYRVHAGGSLHLFAGGDAGGGSGGRIDSYSTGDHMIGAGSVLRLVAHEAIELVCGSSTIRMTQDAIEIRAKKTSITAEKTATLRGGSVAIAGSTAIGGKVVKIASAGASLVLDGDAHLDGGLVKLNCGGSGEGNAGTPVPPDEARKLSLRLLDGFEPYANKKTRVSAGSKHLMTSTQADGLLEVDIPNDATSAVVTVWADDFPDGPTRTWDVKLAELAPASEVVGAQQRLRNLGYYEGSDSGELDEPTRSAIRSFQEDMRIEPATGELDRQTVVALETVHGY